MVVLTKPATNSLRASLELDLMLVQEARSRYTLDLWLPRFNLAIEVDGPFHYGLDVELHPHQHPYAHDPPHQPLHAALGALI